jgi:ElaB/YqjD/DUF883 family membrane-anchored ribosome-binding protein
MEDKILDKVRKLLKLAGSPNEAEASAAYEKAHALLKEHNLNVTDIVDEKPDVEGKVVLEQSGEELWKRSLLNILAKSNYCALISLKGNFNGHTKRTTSYKMFGREDNIATTLVMYEYLSKVVRRESLAAKKTVSHLSVVDFRKAMVGRLAQRLEEMHADERASSAGTALVVIDAEAEEALRKAYPEMATSYSKIRISASSRMGAAAADKISLNRQVDDSNRLSVRELING